MNFLSSISKVSHFSVKNGVGQVLCFVATFIAGFAFANNIMEKEIVSPSDRLFFFLIAIFVFGIGMIVRYKAYFWPNKLLGENMIHGSGFFLGIWYLGTLMSTTSFSPVEQLVETMPDDFLWMMAGMSFALGVIFRILGRKPKIAKTCLEIG
ncbi:MAG: hypothetical protein V4439_00335 [Patescibacteria group bacterium]